MQDQSLKELLTGAVPLLLDEYANELRWAITSEPALHELSLSEVAKGSGQWQGETWAAVLRCYRGSGKRLWGPVLLAMIAPQLDRALNRLHATPPFNDDDLQQEIVLQVLEAAASSRLPADPRWIPLHLEKRALQVVARRLKVEQKRRPLSLEALDASGELAYKGGATSRRGQRCPGCRAPNPASGAAGPRP